jgi:hypothetical protein
MGAAIIHSLFHHQYGNIIEKRDGTCLRQALNWAKYTIKWVLIRTTL